MRLPGLGPKTARRIWKELGITTAVDLKAAAEAQQLRGHAGIGPGTEEKIAAALAKPKATEGPRRALLGTTLPKLRAVVQVLSEHPASVEVSIAGSARRMRETVRDLDIIATATDAQALVDYFCGLSWVVDVAAKGSTKATVVSHDGLRFDLRVVPPESYGNLLQHFTGSKHHNVALREDAVRRGFSVSEYSVTEVESGQEHSFGSEEEVYRFLGYDWIPPELRENGGELAAARKGELPALVELSDLRGDLHTHTTWSDGKDSLEDMVAAAIARGYSYYAVCDHSQRLRGELLHQQAEQIDALNELVAPFRILKGIEVNVRPDGTLDVSEEELATRDWVVASVHSRFDHNPTERVIAAMESPYVDAIGHVTNRKIGKRPPSPVDVERVIEQALETGTFLEINSQPDRLDLTDVHARAAREAGLKVVIDSDGHEIGALDFVELGVGQARRAWLTKADVLNTRTWKQIEKLRKKR
jgi:DNA polymerase (family 10)